MAFGNQKEFKTMEDAQKRVDTLKTHGIWPGIVIGKDGIFRLTYNPSISDGLGTGRSPAY